MHQAAAAHGQADKGGSRQAGRSVELGMVRMEGHLPALGTVCMLYGPGKKGALGPRSVRGWGGAGQAWQGQELAAEEACLGGGQRPHQSLGPESG